MKALRCIGYECDFVAACSTEDACVRLCREHAAEAHNLALTPVASSLWRYIEEV